MKYNGSTTEGSMMLTEKMIINEDGVIINDLGNTIDIKDFINKILEKDNLIVFLIKIIDLNV